MKNYNIYRDNLNTGEVFVIELSNDNTEKVQIVIRYVNNINEVINKKTTFNNKEPNTCYIIIDYKDYKKTREIVGKAWQDLNQISVKDNVKVIYTNETEHQIAEFIEQKMSNVIIEEQRNDNKKEEEIKDEFNKYLSVNTIKKEDNGIIRNYIERKSDEFNTGYMLEGITAEEMYNMYNKLLLDDNNKVQFSTMNEQEIANYVLDYIASTGNYKKYYLESSREQIATNTVGAVAGAVAQNNDGIVNKEIGVVQNNPSYRQERIQVEEDNNKVNVVEPQTTNTTVTPNSYSFNHSSTSDYYSQNNDFSSYDNEEHISEEEQNREQEKSNVYVRKKVLSNPYNAIDTNKGMVSLPAIIFILSGLLLIASIILYIASK